MGVMLIILGGELSSAPVAFLASMYGKQLETGSTLTMYGYTKYGYLFHPLLCSWPEYDLGIDMIPVHAYHNAGFNVHFPKGEGKPAVTVDVSYMV
ncbi:MAG: hypothetical protein PHQ24_09670 [Proteiniphilum sp.]|nr:hypothetical protein [Proteiniphilum sp.]